MKFKAKFEEVKYPVTDKYIDDSKSVLNEIGDGDDADDVAHDDDELLEVDEQGRSDEEDVVISDLEK